MLVLLLACSSSPATSEVVSVAAPAVAPAPVEAVPAPVAPPPAPVEPAVPPPVAPAVPPAPAVPVKAVASASGSETPAPAAPAAPAEDPALQARLDAAKKVIDGIYVSYQKETDPPDSVRYYSRGLKSKYYAVEKYEEAHDTLIFDFDPIINGQEWDISNVKTVATAVGDNVQVVATFKNLSKSEKITFTMILEGDVWVIDDIRHAKWDLRKVLKVPS